MTGILIGAQHKQGVFEDSKGRTLEYDNLELTLSKPVESVNQADRRVDGVGSATTTAKCPWSKLDDVFQGKIKSIDGFEELLGVQINCFFDTNKKLELVLF